jgi:hypothetical protein
LITDDVWVATASKEGGFHLFCVEGAISNAYIRHFDRVIPVIPTDKERSGSWMFSGCGKKTRPRPFGELAGLGHNQVVTVLRRNMPTQERKAREDAEKWRYGASLKSLRHH